MTFVVPIALFGWPLVVILLFAMIRPRWAVIAGFLFAWLFLPVARYRFEGIPEYTKSAATVYGVMLGMALFDARRLLEFRPSWIDIPMALWCMMPLTTSLANGLGAYDGFSEAFSQIVEWGLPYLIGRLYFSDLAGLRELAIAVFLGGLVYVPFCLWEVRMSPRLHRDLYGFHQHSFAGTRRFGGYRPMVFMQHGLAVGMWMSVAALAGIWLWSTGAMKRLWNVGTGWAVLALVGTAVLCKSLGALALLVLGTATLFTVKWLGTRVTVVVLVATPVSYVALRATGTWDGSHLVRAIEAIGVEERARSLQYRFDAEAILVEHAMRKPVLGWGGWGRNRPAKLGYAADDVATDGLWVIALGKHGIVGLAALFGTLLLPVVLLLRKMPISGWWHPLTAPAAVLGIAVTLFTLDSLLNAMVNPIFILAVGGLSGFMVRQSAGDMTFGIRGPLPQQ